MRSLYSAEVIDTVHQKNKKLKLKCIDFTPKTKTQKQNAQTNIVYSKP